MICVNSVHRRRIYLKRFFLPSLPTAATRTDFPVETEKSAIDDGRSIDHLGYVVVVKSGETMTCSPNKKLFFRKIKWNFQLLRVVFEPQVDEVVGFGCLDSVNRVNGKLQLQEAGKRGWISLQSHKSSVHPTDGDSQMTIRRNHAGKFSP